MGKYTGFDFLCGQLQKVPQIEPIDLTGQTVLVVGANIGLGLESAKDFARMGPGNLAIACRSMKKAEDAAKEIREATGFDRISCYAVDLSVFASVVNFAAEFERNESRLDIFMYNASVASILYEPTPDGWESSLQINDLSCLLLSILLLPLVMRTSEQMKTAEHRPRIVVVTSGTHYWVGPKQTQYDSPHILETLSDKEYCTQKGGMAGRYPLTKLLQVLLVRELATRVPASAAIVCSVSPSLCDTGLRRRMWDSVSFLRAVRFELQVKLLAHSAKDGSRFLTWAAIADRHREREFHGKYIQTMKVMEESDFAVSKDGYQMQEKLWDEMVEILSRVSPRYKEVVDTYLPKRLVPPVY